MKARFLLFLLFAILLQVNTSSFAREMKTARRIELRVKAQAQHRSILISPVASVEGSLVSIDFLSVIPSVTITVKNAETDKVVYSSTELNVNDCTVDLAGENPGKYTIDIYIGENIFSGSFFIEEESNYQI